METAQNQAKALPKRSKRIVLSERDFAMFVEIIENPKLPTRELREAMVESQRLRAAHPEANL